MTRRSILNRGFSSGQLGIRRCCHNIAKMYNVHVVLSICTFQLLVRLIDVVGFFNSNID